MKIPWIWDTRRDKVAFVILVVIPLLLLLTCLAFAGPLDILDAKGEFGGRFGQEYFEADGSIANNIIFNVTQGVRFQGAPWIEPYIGFNKAQAVFITGGNTESLYGGVRNKTWLAPLQFGVEYRSTVVPQDPAIRSVVGYVSVYKGWDLNK